MLLLSEIDQSAYDTLNSRLRLYAACVGRSDTSFFKRKRRSLTAAAVPGTDMVKPEYVNPAKNGDTRERTKQVENKRRSDCWTKRKVMRYAINKLHVLNRTRFEPYSQSSVLRSSVNDLQDRKRFLIKSPFFRTGRLNRDIAKQSHANKRITTSNVIGSRNFIGEGNVLR